MVAGINIIRCNSMRDDGTDIRSRVRYLGEQECYHRRIYLVIDTTLVLAVRLRRYAIVGVAVDFGERPYWLIDDINMTHGPKTV